MIRTMTRRSTTVVAVLVLAFAAAGCGGDDGDDATQEWANSVCTDMGTWVTSIQATVEGLTAKGLGIQKSDIDAAVDEAKSATDTLVTGINELGAPEGEAAQQAKSELDELGTQLQEQVANVEQAAASDSGPIQLAQTVGAAVSASAAAAKSTFEAIQSLDAGDELKSAFEDADCVQDAPRSDRRHRLTGVPSGII